jgi:hypothetical protein
LEREAAGLKQAGIATFAVGPGSQATATRVGDALRLSFPVIGDAGPVYDLLGFRRVLGLLQQSGLVVVDRGGVLRLVHRTANPADALPLEQVRDLLTRLC